MCKILCSLEIVLSVKTELLNISSCYFESPCRNQLIAGSSEHVSSALITECITRCTLSISQLLRDYRDDTEPSWHLWHMATLSPLGQTHRAHISKHHKIERETPLCCSDSLSLCQIQLGSRDPDWGVWWDHDLIWSLNAIGLMKQNNNKSFTRFTFNLLHTHVKSMFYGFFDDTVDMLCCQTSQQMLGTCHQYGGSWVMFYCKTPHIVLVFWILKVNGAFEWAIVASISTLDSHTCMCIFICIIEPIHQN